MPLVIYVTAQIFYKLQGCKQDSLGRCFSTASKPSYHTCLPAREWYMLKLENMATDCDRCQLCDGDVYISFTMPADSHRLFQRMLFGLVSKFFSCHRPPAAVGWVPGFVFAVFMHRSTSLVKLYNTISLVNVYSL